MLCGFFCDYVLVKDQFYGVSGLSETEHYVLGWKKNLEQNAKRGCA